MNPNFAPLWSEVELFWHALSSPTPSPYLCEVDVDFVHQSGLRLTRPAFWDGDGVWRARFASPVAQGQWEWTVRAPQVPELDGRRGTLTAEPASVSLASWCRAGLLQMSENGRGVVRSDGSPWVLCADTAWALPFRATREQVREYAAFRETQGFNAVLLMAIQPDAIRSTQPRPQGWEEGFTDLADNSLRENVPAYFQRLDELCDELLAHGLVPVWQPVFHGFGWRGGPTAGCTLPPEDIARFARYLVARYGARPALWLPCGDGTGLHETVAAAGAAFHAHDAYAQPTGLHYGPHVDEYVHASAQWADFHWCQTGHSGEHQPEKVGWMWERMPAKAVANGEPTYEEMGAPGRAADWWQGAEAWRNLCAGGTMGVVYGAGSLWQWRQSLDEPDANWAHAHGCLWRDALRFPGAAHVGRVNQIIGALPLHLAVPNRSATYGRPGLLAANQFFVCFLETGGFTAVIDARVPRPWTAWCASTGEQLAQGELSTQNSEIGADTKLPVVVVCQNRELGA